MKEDSHGKISGYLHIDETDKRKNFPKRFFILDKNSGLCRWFKDKPEENSKEKQELRGVININYITHVDILSKSKIEHCFVINTPFRAYYAKGTSKEEAERWVDALNDAGRIHVPQEVLFTNGGKTSSSLSRQNSQKGEGYTTKVVGGVVMKKSANLTSASIPSNSSLNSRKHDAASNTTLNSSSEMLDKNNYDVVIRSGWATKQGHIRKNWKRRFFKLFKNGFAYYKSDKQNEPPIRVVEMNDILMVQETGAHRKNFVFFVATNDKIYYIQADSKSEMASWIASFSEAITSFRESLQAIQLQVFHHSGDYNSLDSMTSSLSGSRASVASSGVVMRTAGRKSPNLNRYSVQQSPSSTLGRKSKEDFRRSMISVAPSGGGNFNLDPQIDKRSAVKPSLVKKKKNTGVRFSLNYMLQKKQQKINNN